MEITTLEDHVRLMLGRLVLENVTLAYRNEALTKALAAAAQPEADDGSTG